MLNPFNIKAQTDPQIRKKQFENEKPGLKEAWGHVEAGNAYYSKKGVWYRKAYEEYLLAITYNHSNPQLNYKTGAACLFSDNKEEASGFLLKALEADSEVSDDILLLTGRALQFSGMYPESIVKLEGYLTSKKSSKEYTALARKWISECKSALNVTNDTLLVEIENIGTEINSDADDYSQILTSDGKSLIFASRRQIEKSAGNFDDSKFDENIFISVLDSVKWNAAVSSGKNITTKFCETPLFISQANDEIYLYAGYENGGDILVSERNKKGEWKLPTDISFNITTSGSETSFAISPSGNEIYYVSDTYKKGEGGKDIFYLKKLTDKKWSKPLNAGALINTEYDEESVRFSKSGDTLWFSSKGHNSIGGFDIFYSPKNSAGEWDSVRNFGYPVNTPWDELFYHPSPENDSSFFFVSNRSGGFGGLDIYKGRLLPQVHYVPQELTHLNILDSLSLPLDVPDLKPVTDTLVIDHVNIPEVTPEPQSVINPEENNDLIFSENDSMKNGHISSGFLSPLTANQKKKFKRNERVI
jgi:tetratricopeptide (TPR) repeat protein